MGVKRASKFNILPLYFPKQLWRSSFLQTTVQLLVCSRDNQYSGFDKRIGFMNYYVINWNRGCGFPRSADAVERYEKRRLRPWTTPNAPHLNCGLPSYNSTLITEVQPAVFVCMCLYVCVQMTCVCSAGTTFRDVSCQKIDTWNGCFILCLRLSNCV